MDNIQSILAVSIVVGTAIVYLFLTFRKKKEPCGSCGCSAVKNNKAQ